MNLRKTGDIFFSILALCLCLYTGGCVSSVKADTSDKIESSQHQVLEELSQKIHAEPNNIDLRIQYASKLSEIGDFTAALRELEYVSKKSPNHIPLLMTRARILMQAGRVQDAQTVIDKILKIEPDNVSAGLMLGYCYLDQGKYDEAGTAFRKITKADCTVRQQVSAYLGLATVYKQKGQKEEVSRCYKEAINLDESLEEVLMQIERESFWPTPISDGQNKPFRSGPSSSEVERIIREAENRH
jgi:predicted Zn-dependent protease